MEENKISETQNIENPNTSKRFVLRGYYFYVIFALVLLFVGYYYILIPTKDFKTGEIFNIEEGSSLRSISKNLEDAGFIKSRAMFEAFVIIYGGENRILPGDYLFDQKIPLFEVARRISKGDRNISPIKITIPEGFDTEEIAEVVDLKLPNFNKEKFVKTAKLDEGYLFPDTYFFFYNDTEEDVHVAMKENYEKRITDLRKQILSLGKTESDIIIMASIIEREAKGDEDRELISGILWARIAKDMRLQVDAAPITYKQKGLPDSPIANPGMESIKAAIYPKSSPYLFYLHGKDGEVRYAKDFDEHRQNKLKYLR